ncbi:hypothetical protein SO802_018874 [Lithocarpus litseifolius]|uniref:DUF7588 domain-containing protein n=1 Tax=Lithocarpus litseifolius TaxID=425828 RepID=A0AAW2CM12_9ROSI
MLDKGLLNIRRPIFSGLNLGWSLGLVRLLGLKVRTIAIRGCSVHRKGIVSCEHPVTDLSRSSSLPEIPQDAGILNSEDYELSDVDLKLGDWNIPKVLRTLKWSEVDFPPSWTLENENYPLQIQNPDQNPDLDFVQQLADGTVRLSFDQSRFRTPLGVELQGVKTRSQVSTPCYTAKQDSVIDQDDDNSQNTPSLSKTDMEDPYQYEAHKSQVNHEILVIKKDFTPDLVALGKEFDSEENRIKREAYRAYHTLDQKKEVLEKWQEFMKEISSNVPFFEYFENHFEWHKKSCVITKAN